MDTDVDFGTQEERITVARQCEKKEETINKIFQKIKNIAIYKRL